ASGRPLGEMVTYLSIEDDPRRRGRCFGARRGVADGVAGIRCAVWAPNARRVTVVGNFNSWDGRRHPMRLHPGGGVWELFIPRLGPGEVYKYEILGQDGLLPLKADPVALATEKPPATGSVVASGTDFQWGDQQWMEERAGRQSTT